MSTKKIDVPQGTGDILFDRHIKKRVLECNLLKLFAEEGYRCIETPTFEYMDVFSLQNSHAATDMYKFSDDEGRLMVLRPESSAPIARVAGTTLRNSDLPIKVSYNQNVFKKRVSLGGHRHELTQSGIELIGGKDERGDDVEMVTLAVRALAAAGLCGFKIELGHAKLFSTVAQRLPLSATEQDQLRSFMQVKNTAALKDMLSRYKDSHPDECAVLCELPMIFGGEPMLDKAKTLFERIDGCAEIINHIASLYETLVQGGHKGHVSFDFGLVHGFEYYTGIIFSGYGDGFGEALLDGGRYDTLHAEFGKSRAAVGFAINVDAVLDVLEQPKTETPRPLRIALTKGRLQKKACELLASAGIEQSQLTAGTRKLIIPIADGKYELILAKAADVITYVNHGVCDVGLVGKDTLKENGGSHYEVMDTGFGRCKFALAAPKGFSLEKAQKALTIATKYPRVTKEFMSQKGLYCEIIKIEGSVELAPLLGLADAIVDIVETGETLRANGLEVVEDVCDISARIIANIPSVKLRKNDIGELLTILARER